jgi:predicted nucleic acid-binding protein
MRILVDTNVLLRAIQPDSPSCAPARSALKILHRENHELCLTPQNVREFWNACTVPPITTASESVLLAPSGTPSFWNGISAFCRIRR